MEGCLCVHAFLIAGFGRFVLRLLFMFLFRAFPCKGLAVLGSSFSVRGEHIAVC